MKLKYADIKQQRKDNANQIEQAIYALFDDANKTLNEMDNTEDYYKLGILSDHVGAVHASIREFIGKLLDLTYDIIDQS